MKEILKDIISYCETGEIVRVTRDSYYEAFQPFSREMMRQPIVQFLSTFEKGRSPEDDAKKWPECFGLIMIEDHRNPDELIFRKK